MNWTPSERIERKQSRWSARLELLKDLGPLLIIPGVIVVIGVMFILGWNQEPNPNAWWTEVRKEQELLKVEPILTPEYTEVSDEKALDRDAPHRER